MTEIEHYSFGKICIDGNEYHDDVIILHGKVISPWWRKDGGHVFSPGDLKPLVKAKPKTLVLGLGSVGMVDITPATEQTLEKAGIRVIKARTAKAVEKFNKLAQQGESVAAALHLTC